MAWSVTIQTAIVALDLENDFWLVLDEKKREILSVHKMKRHSLTFTHLHLSILFFVQSSWTFGAHATLLL